MKYNTYTLSNGLRVIHLPSASPVVYCGYEIAAGTRDEEPGEEGLAHFVEHVTFKGTARRSSLQILNTLERVGGDLNAFTQKEDTVYYAAILKEHLPKAVDVLTDIVFHSTYPQTEIDKEVEVICDEIESYNDSPAELIYDDFENILFEGHPLGHNILGNAERVRKFTTEDALRFARKYYTPENSIFFAYGDVEFEKLVRLLEKEERGEKGEEREERKEEREMLSGSASNFIIREKGTHQAHVMLGTRAYDIHHPLRIPLYLLNNLLGGPGMNARLNISLRERNGLVYTVESTMVSYGDTGLWGVYFGCDPHDVKRCLRLVRRELDKIIEKPLTDSQLKAAKRQLKGQIGIACDNREQFALDFGKSFLHYGWEKDITSLYSQIEEVTAEQIQQVARELMSEDRITTLVYK
ncbi:MAG: insulinase family protein [Prevotella sp.]|nr:insulinase family protein [Prevotella sp.]